MVFRGCLDYSCNFSLGEGGVGGFERFLKWCLGFSRVLFGNVVYDGNVRVV